MSFLNKKVLAAAVVGTLFSGAAFAAPLDVTPQYYAQEIVIPANGLVPAAAPALTWKSGYNYSSGEVKYVRVELTGATFTSNLTTLPTVTNTTVTGDPPVSTTSPAGNVGAINGLGTNVITFSVTSTNGIVSTSDFRLPLAGQINIRNKGDVSVKVSVYDQASEAQAGGTNGLLTIGSYDDTVFLSFVRSYAFANNAGNTVVADVATTPTRYGNFVPSANSVALAATLNNNLGIVRRDVDPNTPGPQYARRADGSEIQLTDLFAAGSEIKVEGDFSAASAVTRGGAAPVETATGTPPTFPNTLTWTGVPTGAAAPLVYTVPGNRAIPASNFTATFNPVAASAAYEVAPLTLTNAGAIRRNGVELQAPFVQVPPAWTSRLVMTNTGTSTVNCTITFMSEDGNTNYTGARNLPCTIRPGTNVIDLQPIMTSFADMQRRRGSIVVQAEATDGIPAGATGPVNPTGTIQGLLQIVNLQSNSITNHVLVRPGTN